MKRISPESTTSPTVAARGSELDAEEAPSFFFSIPTTEFKVEELKISNILPLKIAYQTLLQQECPQLYEDIAFTMHLLATVGSTDLTINLNNIQSVNKNCTVYRSGKPVDASVKHRWRIFPNFIPQDIIRAFHQIILRLSRFLQERRIFKFRDNSETIIHPVNQIAFLLAAIAFVSPHIVNPERGFCNDQLLLSVICQSIKNYSRTKKSPKILLDFYNSFVEDSKWLRQIIGQEADDFETCPVAHYVAIILFCDNMDPIPHYSNMHKPAVKDFNDSKFNYLSFVINKNPNGFSNAVMGVMVENFLPHLRDALSYPDELKPFVDLLCKKIQEKQIFSLNLVTKYECNFTN